MTLDDTICASLRTISASNGLVAISLLPELGAKLSSLRDLRSGREWLWASERIALARQSHGASYIECADTGGWDECFPTVAPCRYPLEPHRGRVVPDHGDLWSQSWDVRSERYSDRIEIGAWCNSRVLPCELVRTIIMPADTARIVMEYEIRNRGADEVAFIWSAHPLFRIEPGMRLRLPATARFHVYSSTPATQLPARQNLSWPVAARIGGRDVQLDPLPGPEAGIAFKLWSEPLSEGTAALIARDGELHMQFDVDELPQIALWLNAGGWSGIGGEHYYNLALEPCIGAQDSLEEAVTKYGQYAMLRPGEARRWTLTVELRQ